MKTLITQVSQAYETSVSKKRLHTKRTTLHFVVGNERFPLLLGTNNALRIFMVLSETKSALVIKKFLNVIAYLQSEIQIFLVFVSLGDLTFFRATWLKFRATWLRFRATWLRARWLSGDLTGYRKKVWPISKNILNTNKQNGIFQTFSVLKVSFHFRSKQLKTYKVFLQLNFLVFSIFLLPAKSTRLSFPCLITG